MHDGWFFSKIAQWMQFHKVKLHNWWKVKELRLWNGWKSCPKGWKWIKFTKWYGELKFKNGWKTTQWLWHWNFEIEWWMKVLRLYMKSWKHFHPLCNLLKILKHYNFPQCCPYKSSQGHAKSMTSIPLFLMELHLNY